MADAESSARVALLEPIEALLRDASADWDSFRFSELLFARREAAILTTIVLVGLALCAVLARSLMRRRLERDRLALPAILRWTRHSRLSFVRHGALLLFLAGLPFFAIALSDPYTALTHREVSFPGRRIAVMIDASSSMMASFPVQQLGARAPNEATFFATVGAAEKFIRQRINGRYRDLISLIEFGDEAYVITPFTNDYNNILLSLSLVGDWTEFMRFPDQGTTIGKAIEEGVELFRAFDFLNAAGNLMLIFSDGQDSQVMIGGRNVSEIVAGAVKAKIPVYFVRTSYNKSLGNVIPDHIWQPAVQSTGGKFYAAADEATILRAIEEIDQASSGTISFKQYSTERPAFSPFALMAAALWTLAIALKLTFTFFQRFP